MSLKLGLILSLLFIGCESVPIAPSLMCEDWETTKGAVLEVTLKQFGYANLSISEAQRDLEEVERVRSHLNAIENPCVRKAYEHWLDYFEREAKEDIIEFQQREKERATARDIPRF